MARLAQDLSPKEIVAELDRYVVGQTKAKRAVAIALRNRWRRQKVSPELRDDILPKNIVMIGPTGVGKTEIARRLARLAGAPFVKVEASKFTEVGYVGRDVDSMVRDLVEAAVKLVKEEETEKLRERAREAAEEKVLDALGYGSGFGIGFRSVLGRVQGQQDEPAAERTGGSGGNPSAGSKAGRDKARAQLRAGTLDDEMVEVELAEKSMPVMPFMGPGMEDMAQGLQDMMQSIGNNPIISMLGGGAKKRKRRLKVKEALELLTQDEASRMVDMERVVRDALDRAQNAGIVFIDEIDKIAGRDAGGHGPDVSRGGVQRDLLPIVEGSNVTTKYGVVKTDHVLFIAAGAFHVAKVSDLIPELQGRFPIRVELEPLSRADLVRILKEPRSSLVRQYTALLATEGVDVQFRDEAIEEVARIAADVNERMENIGARRLYTVMERLLDELSFDAADLRGQRIVVDAAYVRTRLEGIATDEDLSRYIL
jgi:ATP-dependent HslUV protease ATP-binding subunit HslU